MAMTICWGWLRGQRTSKSLRRVAISTTVELVQGDRPTPWRDDTLLYPARIMIIVTWERTYLINKAASGRCREIELIEIVEVMVT